MPIRHATIFTTALCNLNCKYCYICKDTAGGLKHIDEDIIQSFENREFIKTILSFGDNIEETLCNRKFKSKISISKEQASEWQRKANRKASREEEIEAHGKPINHSHVFRDRTKYNRKDKHKNNRYE